MFGTVLLDSVMKREKKGKMSSPGVSSVGRRSSWIAPRTGCMLKWQFLLRTESNHWRKSWDMNVMKPGGFFIRIASAMCAGAR
jgi:hypothetical protein